MPLPFRDARAGSYELEIPTNPGSLLPGHWMLFAMNAQGTPSVARTMRVTLDDAPSPGADRADQNSAGAARRVRIAPRRRIPGGRTSTW